MSEQENGINIVDGRVDTDTTKHSAVVTRLRTIRNISWGLVLIMTMAFAGYVGWSTFGPQQQPPTAKEVSQSLIKSEFELIDHRGRTVTANEFLGKWQLVFFGYTFCPDVCPTTLSTVAEAMDILGKDADSVVPLFISVDPDRDTPEILAEYVQAFHPKLIGLTGSVDQVRSAASSFRVYFAKASQNDDQEDYLMGHSGFIYLMTPTGTYEEVFSHDRDTPETIAAAIKNRIQKL